jgi:hypothetical protein
MSKIDDLLTHVADAELRQQLQEAIDEIKARRQFGIVFEQRRAGVNGQPEELLNSDMRWRR